MMPRRRSMSWRSPCGQTSCTIRRCYMRAGVRNVILPKPVTTSRELLERLTDEVAKLRVKVAVASQWYYSDLPRIIRREIKRVAGQPDAHLADIRLDRVE